MQKAFLIFVLTTLPFLCHADDRLAKAFPGKNIVISRYDAEEIKTVYSLTQDSSWLLSIREMFSRQGLWHPLIDQFSATTIVADLAEEGAALILSAEETAQPVFEPLFSIADMRFAVVDESVDVVPAEIVHQSRSILGSGRKVDTAGYPKIVLVTHGPLKDVYEMLLYSTKIRFRDIRDPNKVPLSDARKMMDDAGLTSFGFRGFFEREKPYLADEGTALMVEAQDFAGNGLSDLADIIPDPHVHLMTRKIAFRDVTPVVAPAVAASQKAVSEPLIKPIDRSSALALPPPEPRVVPQTERRTRPTFDFANLAANTCHVAMPNDAPDRVALVIGNGAYIPNIGWLENPPNDAQKIADLLFSLGIGIYYTTEATRETVEACADRLVSDNASVDIALLFFAGHGLQLRDENYALGINADLSGELEPSLISVTDLTNRLRRISRSTLILLDACRDNPFATDGVGLAAVGDGGTGDAIPIEQNDFAFVYAAAPNAVASDGTGENSPFSEAVLTAFAEPGIAVQEAIVRVSAQVQRSTDYQQQPFIRSNLTRLIYIGAENNLEDLITTSEQMATQARDALNKGRRSEALELLLSSIPSNASDAEILAHFGHGYELLRNAYLANVYTLENLKTPAISALVMKEAGRSFVMNQDLQAQLRDEATGEILYSAGFSSAELASYPQPTMSGNQSVVAYAADEKTIVVLNTETGNELLRFESSALPDDIAEYSQLSSLQFTDDGSVLLIGFFNWNVLIDVQQRREITGFGSIILDERRQYQLQALNLTADALCFSLKSNGGYGAEPFFAVGRMDLKYLSVETAFTDERDIGVERVHCSPDGRIAAYSSYGIGTDYSARLLEIIDLENGKVIARQDNRATNAAPPQITVDPNGDRMLVVSDDGVRLLDLESGKVVFSEQPAEWQQFIGDYARVSQPPHADIWITPRGLVNERVFDVGLQPGDFIDRAFLELPESVRSTVASRRPLMPD